MWVIQLTQFSDPRWRHQFSISLPGLNILFSCTFVIWVEFPLQWKCFTHSSGISSQMYSALNVQTAWNFPYRLILAWRSQILHGGLFAKYDNSHRRIYIKLAWFPYIMVVKIESRSFSSAEIQHFRTENMRSDYNYRILMIYVVYKYKLL
jgi:hypothetical protein